MIIFRVKELLEKNKISRYKLQKLTNWNYKRINSYYHGKVLSISTEELNRLCKIFNCSISELIEYKED